MDAGIKPYPTCRWFHTGIKLLEDIMKEHKLNADDIDRIVVNGDPRTTLPLYINADNWTESPKELWTSQFSYTYALACTVHGVTPGPEWAKERMLNDPKIAATTEMITHGVHPDAAHTIATWNGHPGRLFSELPCSIEVRSKKDTFTAESSDVPGDSWNPGARLSDSEMIEKFKNNACNILSNTRINRIIETVDNLDKLDNVDELTGLVAS